MQVAYAAKDLQADIIVDVATLTGAQGMATGNTESLIAKCYIVMLALVNFP